MARRDPQAIIDRTTGVSRGETQSARNVSQALGKGLGKTRFTIYNLDTSDLSDQRKADIIEAHTGRKASKSQIKKFKAVRVKSADFRQRTRPTDNVSGERLNIYRDMKAYQITFS